MLRGISVWVIKRTDIKSTIGLSMISDLVVLAVITVSKITIDDVLRMAECMNNRLVALAGLSRYVQHICVDMLGSLVGRLDHKSIIALPRLVAVDTIRNKGITAIRTFSFEDSFQLFHNLYLCIAHELASLVGARKGKHRPPLFASKQ